MLGKKKILLGLFALLLAGCAAVVKTENPLFNYTGDLTIKLLACNYQIKCLEGLCMAKLVCPPGIEHNP